MNTFLVLVALVGMTELEAQLPNSPVSSWRPVTKATGKKWLKAVTKSAGSS